MTKVFVVAKLMQKVIEAELVLLNKHQIWSGGAYLNCYLKK